MTVKMRSYEEQKMISGFIRQLRPDFKFNDEKARVCAGRLYDIYPEDLMPTMGLVRLDDGERSFLTESMYIEKFIERRENK